MERCLILICALMSLSLTVGTDVFSSTVELEELYRKDKVIITLLQKYIDNVEEKLTAVRRFVSQCEGNRQNILSPSQIVGDPIDAYKLVKRMTVDWDEVKASLKLNDTFAILKEVLNQTKELPTFEDFIGAAMSVMTLQDTYSLNMSLFTKGQVRSSLTPKLFQSAYTFTARDCLFIGKAAFNKGLYDKAIQWLEAAMAKVADNDKTTTEKEIRPFLKTTIRVHDETLRKKGPLGENWQTFEFPVNGTKPKKVNKYQPQLYKRLPLHLEMENFKRLCRGENLRSARDDAVLKCRLLHHSNPFLKLGPFKLEEVSLLPSISIFHEFLSHEEADTLKRMARPHLHRSLHRGKKGTFVATDTRTSKQAWLSEEDDPIVQKLNDRVSAATNMLVYPEYIASEFFQVANYGIGGRYTPHADFLHQTDDGVVPEEGGMDTGRGNRMATFMTYLEDVESGGATVFPIIGRAVWPRKGMAVFWYNLMSNGAGDPLTRHGSCPVLHGTKWICNKWIRSHEQMFRLPCDVKNWEYLKFP